MVSVAVMHTNVLLGAGLRALPALNESLAPARPRADGRRPTADAERELA